MHGMKGKNRTLVHLSTVLIVTAIFIIFSMSFSFLDESYGFLGMYGGLPLAQYLINAIFLLLIALIWFTYRRWREWAEIQKKLY